MTSTSTQSPPKQQPKRPEQKLWSEGEILEWLQESVDKDRLRAVQRMRYYCVTGNWDAKVDPVFGGLWPYYEDFPADDQQIGRANKTLNSARQVMSRLLSSDIEPETKGITDEANKIRKGIWAHRSKGDNAGDGGWGNVIESHFLDYRMVGVGVSFASCKWDYGDVWEDDEWRQYVTLANSSQTDVVWTRGSRHPSAATEVCFRVIVPFRQAVGILEEAGIKNAKETAERSHIFTTKQGTQVPCKGVAFHMFFSTRQPGRKPTWAVWIGDGQTEDKGTNRVFVQKPDDNPFNGVPWNVWENFLPPGAMWPLGSIYLEATMQQAIEQLDEYWRSFLKNPPIIGIRDELFVPGDLTKVLKGERRYARLRKDVSADDVKAAMVEYRGAEAQQTVLAYREACQREYNIVAGLAELETGVLSQQQRTLGENQLAVQSSQSNRALDERKVAKGLAGLVTLVFDCMKRFDRSPMKVDLDGYDYLVNDPGDPRTWCDQVFADVGTVTIDPGALTGMDDRARSLQAVNDLLVMKEYVGRGINPEKFLTELVTRLGEPDSREWLMLPDGAQVALGQLMATLQAAGGQQLPAPPAQAA